jgi:putative ABC transport system ATP-binding protein
VHGVNDDDVLVRGVGLSKAYGGSTATVQALRDVTVDVRAGTLTVITGPSGSGKTTLLHCLSGLATPDAGQVLFAGTDLTQLDDSARSRQRRDAMGFVFQRDNLLPALTVRENAALPMLLQGVSRDELEQRVTDCLAAVGLAERSGAFPSELSGGQMQRAAVARALSSRPKVLWADEPTGALDSAAAAEVMALLRSLTPDGCAVVVVTHAADLAEQADQVAVLRDGRRIA